MRSLAVLFLLAPILLAAPSPVAEAHTCGSTDPSVHPRDVCGECSGFLPHAHYYSDGSVYCTSTFCVDAVLFDVCLVPQGPALALP